MSILNDLDPANARLPATNRTAHNRLIPWASASLLLVAGTAWVYLANDVDEKGGRAVAPVALATDTLVPASPPSPTPATTSSEVERDGVALIRNTQAAADKPLETGKQPNAFAALQEEITSADKVPTKNVATTPASPVTATTNQRTDQKPRSTTKTAKREEKKASTNGQRQTKAAKKPSERDIEIISAIVK